MPDIVVDGVRYVPEGDARPSIGVGITTHNRYDAFRKTYDAILRHTPGAKVVVVDDASTKPVPEATHRFEQNVGIATAKNRCLQLLDDCDHIFLFDDDTHPVVDEWWRPYVESPEPHLALSWNLVEIYRDDQHAAFHASGGCMLYVERRVLDVVGGMETCFGRWGWEHVNWSDRIHNAGLTTWRYADVVDSGKLFYPMDRDKKVKTTATRADVERNQGEARELYMGKRFDSHYVEYRDLQDVVITTLFTGQKDPQRGTHLKPSTELLKDLAQSVCGAKLVVLHDELTNPTLGSTEFVKVPAVVNPYFQRWVSLYQYLRATPGLGRVWCVDGTDVTMLRPPFAEMEPGTLYVGSEPSTLRNEWIVRNHPNKRGQDFLAANPNLPLLNAGLLGGDAQTVERFAHHMGRFYFDDHIEAVQEWDRHRVGVGDMVAFNYVARTHFPDVLSAGPHVNTVFKAYEKANTTAWWQHK